MRILLLLFIILSPKAYTNEFIAIFENQITLKKLNSIAGITFKKFFGPNNRFILIESNEPFRLIQKN